MEDRETARMRKYGESKTTRIMMATVPHVTSDLGLRKFQADGFLLTRMYTSTFNTVRLQRDFIIFKSSSGSLHQTNIYKTEMNYQLDFKS